MSKLPEVSKETVAAYHDKARMTLSRDVEKLTAMKLIAKQEGGGYLANKGLILAFLPGRALAEAFPTLERDTPPAART